jgi:hypothetical protein
VAHVARQVVAAPASPAQAVPISQRETPGVHGAPVATGGARMTQICTPPEPMTHSSVAAHWASLVQVARQVVAPPGRPVHVVPPRHRVTLVMQASPGIASGGLGSHTRAPFWPATHSSVLGQFVSVVQVVRQVVARPTGPVQVPERQNVPPMVHAPPSGAVGSWGCRHTAPLHWVPALQVALQGRLQ